MKKILYGLGIFIGLIVISCITVPYFVNLNHYKPLIEDEVFKQTNRKLTIDGDIKISILPEPSLNIQDIKLASIKGTQNPHFVTLKQLKIKVKLLPLLSKKLEVTRILIVNPKIVLEQLKNGRANWDLTLKKDIPSKNEVTNNKILTAKPTDSPMDCVINNVEIVSGEITYITPTSQQTIHDLTTTWVGDSLTGPFKLDGLLKYAEQDIRFQLKIKQLSDSIPMKLKLDLDSSDLNVEGVWTQSVKQFQGSFDAKSNAKSLEATVRKTSPTFNLPEFVSGPINVNGRLIASDKEIKIDNLTINIDQESITGRVAAVLSPLTINGESNGIPGKTNFSFEMKSQGTGQVGQVRLMSQSPRKLMKWMAIPTAALIPDELNGLSNFNTNFTVNGSQINLSNIDFKVKNAAVSGTVKGNYADNSCDYDLGLQGLVPIAQFLRIPVHSDPGLVRTSGTLKYQDDVLIYDNKSNVAGANLQSSGEIKVAKTLQANVAVKAQAADAHTLFKIIYAGPPPVDSFNISSNVIYNDKVLNLDNLNIMLKSHGSPFNLNGFVHAQIADRQLIDAELTIGTLKLDALFPVASNQDEYNVPKFRHVAHRVAPVPTVKNHLNDQQKTDPTHLTLHPNVEHWSSIPINLSFLSDFDGKFKVSIDQISRHDLVFKNFVMMSTLDKGVFNSSDFVAEFFDGKLQGSLNLDVSSEPRWSTQLDIKDASVQRLMPATGTIKIVKGTLNANGNFNSQGKSLRDWIDNLQGRFHFDIAKGSVSGFDLKSLNNKLKSISNPVSIIELLTSSMTGGKTDFSDCTATINFEQGIGTFQTLSLIADGGQGSGAGHIDLPRYQLDLTGEFTLTDIPNLPPFKMRLYGMLDNPNKSFDTSILEKYFIDNVFSLKGFSTDSLKNAGDFIGGLVGSKNAQNSKSKGSPEQAPEQTNSNNKDDSSIADIVKKPTEAIGNVFKGLF